jgi:hypothetical protein
MIGVGLDSLAAILIRSLLPFFGEYEMETIFSSQGHAAKSSCRDFSSDKFPRSVYRGAGTTSPRRCMLIGRRQIVSDADETSGGDTCELHSSSAIVMGSEENAIVLRTSREALESCIGAFGGFFKSPANGWKGREANGPWRALVRAVHDASKAFPMQFRHSGINSGGSNARRSKIRNQGLPKALCGP